ncbi:MAG: hypothetical protein IPG53_23365 [Ignavibacteriales bacterium]|nr:hypothetical protein [Ignavibacteriales bacterium]
MRLLRETILPELVIKNRNTRTLNVLSAASSSGEELYSIAILLSEILPEYKTWKITLLGVDINHDAIKKAENGVYSKWSFRSVPEETISKYFVRKNNDFMISESIKEMVLLDILIWLTIFQLFHLEEVNPPLISLFAVMFLSTLRVPVLKAVANFAHLLKKNGYLLTGHSELANMHFPGLKPVAFPDSFIYQKNRFQAGTEYRLISS